MHVVLHCFIGCVHCCLCVILDLLPDGGYLLVFVQSLFCIAMYLIWIFIWASLFSEPLSERCKVVIRICTIVSLQVDWFWGKVESFVDGGRASIWRRQSNKIANNKDQGQQLLLLLDHSWSRTPFLCWSYIPLREGVFPVPITFTSDSGWHGKAWALSLRWMALTLILTLFLRQPHRMQSLSTGQD